MLLYKVKMFYSKNISNFSFKTIKISYSNINTKKIVKSEILTWIVIL